MKILCVICARKGSTNIKNKNLKFFLGKPLILHTINVALKSGIFDKIVVSSDSNKILKLSQKHVHYCIKRPKNISGSYSPKILAIKHALIKSEAEYKTKFNLIFDLDVTAPLRKVIDLLKSLKTFKTKKADMLFSVCKSRKNPYFNMVEVKNSKVKLIKKPSKAIFARQKAPKIFDINASIYIWKRKSLLNLTSFYSGKTSFYEMPLERSIDIDSLYDWKIAEFLSKNY